ncbi:MAG: hypothetical protein R2725_02195 [Solirubrobacterales bacterium]
MGIDRAVADRPRQDRRDQQEGGERRQRRGGPVLQRDRQAGDEQGGDHDVGREGHQRNQRKAAIEAEDTDERPSGGRRPDPLDD